MLRPAFAAAFVVCILFSAACSKWSGDEQRQIDAFRTSVIKAEEASGASAGLALSPDAIDRASAALREAIAASDQVSDPLLARLHPELPEQYRKRFVPALRMRLEAMNTLRTGAPVTARELEWQVPLAEWGRWYDQALPTLRQNIGG